MTCEMCEDSKEHECKSVVAMIADAAGAYYAAHWKNFAAFDGVKDGLVTWFFSEKQKYRPLKK